MQPAPFLFATEKSIYETLPFRQSSTTYIRGTLFASNVSLLQQQQQEQEQEQQKKQQQ